MKRWIIQRKIFRGDWETIAAFYGQKKNAEAGYAHLNGSVRVVSESQAERDYQAGRADNWKRRLEAD